MDESTFRNRGKIFDDFDVAKCYTFRPSYPPDLFHALLRSVSGRSRLLDLGTGDGKIAGALAPHFAEVIALDPSSAMLDTARRTWAQAQNINWLCISGEDAPLAGPYDLVTAGAAIHWMDPAIVFPKLSKSISDDGVVAIIIGDLPNDPPWREAWTEFVGRWEKRLGDAYSPEKWHPSYSAHQNWMTAQSTTTFTQRILQRVDHFVECQHSRASWVRHRMGERLSVEFDTALRCLLAPFVVDDKIAYDVRTDLTIGRPLSGG